MGIRNGTNTIPMPEARDMMKRWGVALLSDQPYLDLKMIGREILDTSERMVRIDKGAKKQTPIRPRITDEEIRDYYALQRPGVSFSQLATELGITVERARSARNEEDQHE